MMSNNAPKYLCMGTCERTTKTKLCVDQVKVPEEFIPTKRLVKYPPYHWRKFVNFIKMKEIFSYILFDIILLDVLGLLLFFLIYLLLWWKNFEPV